ncbi:T9SS type A sorting domain-containing protein [Lewinella sp. LCG006]|uniref:T9SS type A sorting domain-containing protein n=1 Tax=Lewinella sp. LCG006 TaxID=3231911 RepID=UPI00345F5062
MKTCNTSIGRYCSLSSILFPRSFLILLLSTVSLALSAQLATWDFEGEVAAATTVAPNVTATAAVFGPGVGSVSFPAGNGSTDAYSGNGWPTGGLAADRYLQISVETTDPCFELNVTGISFDERRSGTGPATLDVIWSAVDAFSPNQLYGGSIGTAIPDNTDWRTQTFMQTLNESKVIFRIYGYNAEAGTGTWRFDNIEIQGTVTGDNTPPSVTCATFTPSFDSRCPDDVSANNPNGNFGPIPANGIVSLGLGFPGTVFYDLDLSACASDDVSALGELGIRLQSSILGTSDGCSQTLTNTYEIKDACDNISPDLITIIATFEDNEGPEITCAEFTATFQDCPDGLGPNNPSGDWIAVPANGIFQSTSGGSYTVDVDLNSCVSDNCGDFEDFEYTLVDSYFEDFVAGCAITLVNEIALRDGCGNVSDNNIITKITIDNSAADTPPLITCPANAMVACGMPTDPDATGMATATTDCGTPTVTFSDSSAPGCGNTETISRTWTATSPCGMTSTCVQTITVVDDTPPTVSCADFTTTFSNGCSADLAPNVPSGNFGALAANGMVNIALGLTGGSLGGLYQLDLSGCVSDNCSTDFTGFGIRLVSSDVVDNPNGCGQILTNTYDIRDACGNISTDLVTIVANFEDTSAPVVNCAEFTATFEGCPGPLGPNTPTDEWFAIGPAGGFTAASGGGGPYSLFLDLSTCVTDNCSDLADLEYTLFTSYEENTTDCSTTLVNEFSIRDQCGNIAEDRIITRFTIENTSDAMITCPAQVDLTCGDSTDPADTGMATATDECGNVPVTYTDEITMRCNNGAYVIIRTWTAEGCGEPVSCEQFIIIRDEEAPVFNDACQTDFSFNTEGGSDCPADATISLNEGDELTLSDTWTVGGNTVPSLAGCVSDNCALDEEITVTVEDITITHASSCSRIFSVTFIADDGCDNNSEPFTFTYTIEDNTIPVFDAACQVDQTYTTETGGVCPADATFSFNEGDEFGVNDVFSVGGNAQPTLAGCISDNCGTEDDFIVIVDDITVTDNGTCSRNIAVTFIADDGCGNLSESFTFNYLFIDDTAPVFDLACQIDAVFTTEDGNVCPADATISLNEGDEIDVFTGWTVGGVDILPLQGCVGDNCTAEGDLTITVDDITVVDDGTCSRVITITFIADDGCGNFSEPFVCNYTFIDNTGPEVSFNGILDGGTYVVECDLPSTTWDPLIDIGELTISDNCSAIDFAGITEVLTQLYDGPCVGNVLTRWQQVFTVQDICGNTTVYTLFTEIIDTTPPAFTSSPADVTIECDETAPVPQLEAFDSCSEVIYNFNEVRTDGDCPNNYTLTRTWLASDGCGNTSVETQVVTVEDTTPPVIEFTDEYIDQYQPGQDVYIECSEYGNISQIIANSALAFDNCSGQTEVSYSLEDMGNFDCQEYGYSGHFVSTWKTKDECGNESIATINWFLVDETAPVFQGLPEDACASLDNLPPVADVQAVDDCELAVLTFSQSDPIDCDGGQYIERTWTAEDACGNSASYTQRISLNGTSGPTITIDYPEIGDVMDGDLIQLPVDCDQDIAFSVADLEAAISVGAGCGSGSSSIELSLMDEGDCQENGYFARYRLNVTATDACGNTSNLSITIDFVDMTPPVVSSPNELTLDCGDEIPMIEATDACGEIASMTFVDSAPIEVSCAANPVAYDRTWTVTDACGNATTFVQSIIVLDNAGPVFSGVPADMCNNTGIDVVVTAVDGCTGQQAQVFFEEVMSSESGCGEVLTRTWTATDACGNTSVATQQVFFDDDVAPEIAFTSDLVFGLESGDELFLTVGDGLGDPNDPLFLTADDVTVTDNCATITAQVVVETTISDDCAADGYLARYDYKFIATDPCGNTSSAKLTVFYVDNNAPDFFNVPDDVDVFCTAVPEVANVIASDDYDEEVEVFFSETSTTTPEGLLITRTWKASDSCGNTNSVSQNILVVNNDINATFSFGGPVIECNSDNNRLGVTPTGGTPPYTYQWQLTFPLEDGYITTDPTLPGILFTMGYITQTFSVLITDANGCEYLASVTVVCDFSDDEGDFTGNGNDGAFSMNVYPNPVSDQLMVKAKVQEDRPVTVAMYNLFGQELFRTEQDTWAPEGLSIDTRRFPNGTYLLRLTAGEQEVQTREVVILH